MVSDYSAVETEANNLRQSLASAKQILDNDVTYTKVVLEIASVLPSGVALDTLTLDSTTFGSPMVLTANAKSYPTVLNLKDSLQRSSVFSDVSIQSITNSSDGSYPLTAAFSVTIRKDAAQ
jgi:Tfp pilus assembly protein PilN